jgi:hypothetical protein
MAYCGDRLAELDLSRPLAATGQVSLRRGVSDSTSLVGFFHSRDSVTVASDQSSGLPNNFIGIAVEGPSSEGFYFYPAYRFAGMQGYAQGREVPRILPDGSSGGWSFFYLPASDSSPPRIIVQLAEQSVELELPGGSDTVGARFDRFGIVTTWIDGNAQDIYFDDLTYTCRQE